MMDSDFKDYIKISYSISLNLFVYLFEYMYCRRTDVYWLNPVPHVAHTITVLAKDRFRFIQGYPQRMRFLRRFYFFCI